MKELCKRIVKTTRSVFSYCGLHVSMAWLIRFTASYRWRTSEPFESQTLNSDKFWLTWKSCQNVSTICSEYLLLTRVFCKHIARSFSTQRILLCEKIRLDCISVSLARFFLCSIWQNDNYFALFDSCRVQFLWRKW